MFDAIVIGSGMSGGIAAKELCERGFKTLVLERGRSLEHGASYTDWMQPWDLPNGNMVPEDELAADYPIQGLSYAMNEATKHYWVKDSEHPYSTPDGKPFGWMRGYHLGGRSIMWGRQTYRWSEMDFAANAKDGHGTDWPIRYADIAPWYAHIERFIGVSGSREDLPQLPDGEFLAPMGLNDAELDFQKRLAAAFPGRRLIPGRCAHLSEVKPHHLELGRNPCQVRSLCERGCTHGAYHSSLSSSLPAAMLTGNLTVLSDQIAHSIIHNPLTGRATGVRTIDANTGKGQLFEAKLLFLCASTIGSAQLLLRSQSEAFPRGLANSSDMVGRNLMDHVSGISISGHYPGLEDRYYRGRRPTGSYIPRFRNVTEPGDFLRGFAYQANAVRGGAAAAAAPGTGIGKELKTLTRRPGPWRVTLSGYGEMLPNPENRVSLHPTRIDKWGMAQVHIDCAHGENERKIARQMAADGKAMIEAAGGTVQRLVDKPRAPGVGVHEMGTARMGRDPRTSVLNGFNQAHDVKNLFVTDGSAMASSGCQNPSLTYMALTARAVDHAAELIQAAQI